MKNLIKLALVALVTSVTIIACDPPKPKPEEVEKTDSLKAIDTLKKDSVVMKADSVKIDSVKK
ncbi:hypothetical protein IDJ77_03020 [Mucilaginibacter sp. ZT4R22]|uniref:Lipoprotein n=1 Tax=Mucilaginibacter pankratovii TaxID=2772110 RepID=A0ABR7WKB7_9SPHI|nr:hypothetical protein [Mucilaginibacter pankratovii]MBD1362771.1 hypothetical protein [Mucilaginibacter pankratovii]